ncbi:MAG TPA: hypothetical protein VHD36_06330 [Pirellulales bacterium]|nr:hypothetical protein [Pirellulales bacterium]
MSTNLAADVVDNLAIANAAAGNGAIDNSAIAEDASAGDSDSCDSTGCCEQAICDSCGCSNDFAECCDSFNNRKRFLGFLPSDHCFDNFISPISNPFFFEDPRSLTEFRGIFIDNALPAGQVGGGDAQIWAGQFRGRVTDRWSIIAPRLAYFTVNQADSGGSPVGFLSAPVGAKYNLIRDVQNQFLVSIGLTYFIPGAPSALANFGNGDFHLFLTGGKQILGNGHWLSGTGFRLPEDRNWGTQLWYWSNQWDYRLPGGIYPLIGVNWFHYMDSGAVPIGVPFGTLDILNLPSSGVAGSNVVTNVIGARWKPGGHFELGFGWEYPMTQREDVLKNRVYTDFILRY